MLIAMAGLPATGKSTIAERLAQELCGVVLSKDVVRAALFPAPVLDHSGAENDISMDAIFAAAAHIRRTFPPTPVFIDGRTFLRSTQLDGLLALTTATGDSLRVIECVCSDEVARHRLERDLAEGRHPAKNRTYALYLAVKNQSEAILLPHLVLDTGRIALDECVRRSLEYLQSG